MFVDSAEEIRRLLRNRRRSNEYNEECLELFGEAGTAFDEPVAETLEAAEAFWRTVWQLL